MKQFPENLVYITRRQIKERRGCTLKEKRIEDYNRKGFEVKSVLFQTVRVYRGGVRQFAGLSAIALITPILMAGTRLLVNLSVLAAVLLFFLSLGSIYFTIRADVGIFILSRSLYLGQSMTLKESFQSSKGFCGTYFIIGFLFALIIAVPAFGIILAWECAQNPVLKFGVVLVFAILFIYLFTKYYLAMPTALFSEREGGEFAYSSRLVRGNFLQVFVIILLTYGIVIMVLQLSSRMIESRELEVWLSILICTVELAVQILLAPVSIIASVLMYFTLSGDGKRSELPEEGAETSEGTPLDDTI